MWLQFLLVVCFFASFAVEKGTTDVGFNHQENSMKYQSHAKNEVDLLTTNVIRVSVEDSEVV